MRSTRLHCFVVLVLLAAGLQWSMPAQAALGRTIFSDSFESVADTVGGPPSNFQLLTIPPFNDNHSTRWAIESNAAGPTFIDGGQNKSLSWDDVPNKTGDAFNDDGGTQDDFPIGIVYRNPVAAADQPGRIGTYTLRADVRMADVGARRSSLLDTRPDRDPLQVEFEGEEFIITYGALVGAILWPPGAAQPCPPGFGQPGQTCRPAGGLAGGLVLNAGMTRDDPSDDRVEIGALYISGFVNQDDIRQSGFSDTLVPLRVASSMSRADFFNLKHNVSLHVAGNRDVGVSVDGTFYGWGTIDQSSVLVPFSSFTAIGMAGAIRNHTHFDNVLYAEGFPDFAALETTITSGPPAVVTSPSGTFAMSSNRPAAGFECAVDAGAFTACTSPATMSVTDNGTHTFRARAKDARDTDATPATFSWYTDLPPDTVIDSKPPALTNNPNPSFGFSATESSSFECSMDGGAFAACTSPASFAGLADGPHTFAVRATDTDFDPHVDASPAEASFTVDTAAPATTLTSTPPSLSRSRSANFEFTSSEPGSFRCSLDGAAYSACTSPRVLSGLTQGDHTFRVRAMDGAGNEGPDATHAWRVDVPPVTTITSAPPASTNSADATFEFTASEPSTFECSLDGAVFSACSSPQLYAALPDGSHAFSVRATDLDDPADVEAAPASHSWSIDSIAPSVTIGSTPADPSRSAGATFEFSASEPSTFECSLDGAAFGACASPQSYPGLSQGSHSFAVRARDAAGNVSGPSSFGWTVDLVPETTITAAPAAITNASDASFSFVASEAATFECSVDGAAFAPCTSPVSLSGLPDGTHSFAVRSTDLDGTLDVDPTPAQFSWTIDTVVPTASIITGPPEFSEETSANFSFSASEPSTFTCALDAATPSPCTTPLALTGLGEGPHSLAVRAIDAAGNVSDPAIHEWSVATAPPAVPALTLISDEGNDGAVGIDETRNGTRFLARISLDAEPGRDADVRMKVTDGVTEVVTDPVLMGTGNPSRVFAADISSLNEGPIQVIAEATRGTSSAASSETVLFDRTRPTTAITTDPDAVFVSIPFIGLTNLKIEGTAADNLGVRAVALVFENADTGEIVGPVTARRVGPATAPSWSYSGRALNPGTYVVTAYALDEPLNRDEPGATLTITVL